MNAMTWFGNRSAKDKEADRKTDEAISRVIKARETVTDAAERLARALDISDSRMEQTLQRLVHVKRVPK